jgi:hypothetical protein
LSDTVPLGEAVLLIRIVTTFAKGILSLVALSITTPLILPLWAKTPVPALIVKSIVTNATLLMLIIFVPGNDLSYFSAFL